MKHHFFIFEFALSALAYTSSSRAGLLSSEDVQLRSAATCGNVSDAVPLYTAYTSKYLDHFYSTSISQITAVVGSQGYAFEGVAARVFATQELSTVPFYHVFQNVVIDSFYTISTTERDLALQNGYISGSTDAYIYPTQICGSIPFFRLYNSAATEHFYTTSASVCDSMVAAGWEDGGIAGYVLDSNPCA
ncbi:hypothetical protein B0H10DRAFT_2044584 [Mycena sp. CBHHK59/15]|nr:hypothetical protein B0H10DRAFT_2044584 [Mycena sp. CBHHK59/15]